MLKIGDFSKFSRVSVKALRYYDEIGLLKPVKVDELSGYRYYTAEQLPTLNRIVQLKELGLSLQEIGTLIKDSLPAQQLIELLKAKREEALARLYEEETRLRGVEEWLRRAEKEEMMSEVEATIRRVEPIKVASVRGVLPKYSDVSRLYGELFGYLGRKRVQPAGPSMAIYHDEEYKETDADVEAAVPIKGDPASSDRVKVHDLPAVEKMAVIVHKGPYEQISQSYGTLMSWMEAHGYKPAGPSREVYLKGPGMILKGDPRNYVTEIQFPVA
jgi:effector-binding domain-containing protein